MSGTSPGGAGAAEARSHAMSPGTTNPDATGSGPAGPAAAGPAESPTSDLASRVADFWGGAVPMAPDAPMAADPAVARLGVPDLAIRGRNPADLVRPAYDALTSR
ncbi:hypothetical protein [Yinghuangia sp. YIM S09857]|uniref:hypothetical protein n=1 Tax=Yinghuangia sp. YIM S09857 TaxID=3436929 RepID=UPI003F534E45